MKITQLGLAALACASLACATKPTPVTVTGDVGDRALLAGKWSGEYTSPATGRSGSIVFQPFPLWRRREWRRRCDGATRIWESARPVRQRDKCRGRNNRPPGVAGADHQAGASQRGCGERHTGRVPRSGMRLSRGDDFHWDSQGRHDRRHLQHPGIDKHTADGNLASNSHKRIARAVISIAFLTRRRALDRPPDRNRSRSLT